MTMMNTLLAALCRTLLASVFWLSIRLSNSLTVQGTIYDRGAARTYLGMMHKRDIDPFILVPIVLFHRGCKAPGRDVRFALRGDGFTGGFLARIVRHPAWLVWLLRPLAVGPVLRWLGTYPTDGLLRPAQEWIREAQQIEGDVPAADILSPAFIQDVIHAGHGSCQQVHNLPLSQLLRWPYHTVLQRFYGPEMLLHSKRRRIERRLVERIHQQLTEIVAHLWQGGSIFGSPEGQLSPDGHLSPLHAGFYRLMRLAPPDLCILPVGIIYDFMTVGRPHIFIAFAPAIEHAPTLPRRALDEQLRRAWLANAHFTCTQLASGFLIERLRAAAPIFTLHDLVHAVHTQASALAGAGRHVDSRLLRPTAAARRVRSYLAYVERRGLVRRGPPGCWQITLDRLVIEVGPRQVAYNAAPVLYAYNELQDLSGCADPAEA
ncbi:MAG TPA: hypothetical protein VGF67_27345 [Ktedonobacteraceae bacterium]|jgi:hypothetical protein